MLLFLDLSYERAAREGRLRTNRELDEAILHGAVKRVRPKMMTVTASFMGLLPIMWSTSAGADVMKRIAAPMIGGLVTSFLLELLVYPAVYKIWKQRQLSLRPEPLARRGCGTTGGKGFRNRPLTQPRKERGDRHENKNPTAASAPARRRGAVGPGRGRGQGPACRTRFAGRDRAKPDRDDP